MVGLLWCLLALALTTGSYAGHSLQDAEALYNIRNEKQQKLPPSNSCGYGSCPKTIPNKLNVHIIAHTHDDVGWLKTVDQYYYGTNKADSPVGVQHILDSVIPQLMMDRTKRFIYVEMSFFSKWWEEQDDVMKEITRRLVNEGRLEFINGGWCMNDEATVSYQSTIEQMTLGLKFLNESFGSCGHPKVGWQIDPFGHTNEQASLFAQFGFDGMFFSRISATDKSNRITNKSLDLMWHGDRALKGQSGSIFTNVFRDGYDAPQGYCFDAYCKDNYLVDNKKSYEYNMDEKGQYFIEWLRKYASDKLTNHLLIPMGGDFQFTAAGQNFKALDKLISYTRANAPDIHIFYSTPSCYQFSIYQAVEQHSVRLPEKYDDFMPYDSSRSVWWSGYFSSRPSVKLVEREIANLLPVTRVVSLANLIKQQAGKRWIDQVKDHEARCLLPLWEILGDLQHHDAVTGTEKQHVANDYVRRAYDASLLCSKFIGDLRRSRINDQARKSVRYEEVKETGKRFKLDALYLEETMFCPLLNISQCDPMESEVDPSNFLLLNDTRSQTGFRRPAKPQAAHSKSYGAIPSELITKSVLINVYNPLERPISQHDIRLPCNWRCDLEKVKVVHLATNETMRLIRLPVPSGIASLPFREAHTNYEILFYANLPALGYTSFVAEDTNDEYVVDEEVDPSDSIVVTDESDSHKARSTLKSRRLRRGSPIPQGRYMDVELNLALTDKPSGRVRRDSSSNEQSDSERVIVKFDLNYGMIVGLKRVSDGSSMNITQKFGYYYPANSEAPPGAYIFRPNTTEPYLIDKPISYRMFKRKSGALIEIHQKWADWLWQTIRVDAKKNYIEFDYVVGPIPIKSAVGREVVTRYITSMSNEGVFLTDSNARQLLPRRKSNSNEPEELGGSFYPVVSTIMLKGISESSRPGRNSAEAVAILVDRPQAGTSLNKGQLELLIHRRMTQDDNFGVGEPLNEPGEDGRGLVTRGKHRLYLKFQSQPDVAKDNAADYKSKLHELPRMPTENLAYEKYRAFNGTKDTKNLIKTLTYLVQDHIFNKLKQEAKKFAMQPVMTFDRLRVNAKDLVEMIASDGQTKVKTDLTLLNNTLPDNIHLLTLQPWTGKPNEVLIRLENMDNPLTIHPFPNYENYQNLLSYYRETSVSTKSSDTSSCDNGFLPDVEVDIEYLIKKIRFTSLDELNLGANARLREDERLNWGIDDALCDQQPKPSKIRLGPRQIRTFAATFEFI